VRKRSTTRSERRTRLSGIEAAAKAFDAFRPARDVLSVVRAVPTRFVQFDHATKVGGLPIERFTLMHGPSGEGKTAMSLGLLASFLARDHLAMLVDAERTTPITWARAMMGRYADHPGFFAVRPRTYEETVETVRKFVMTIKKQRDEGTLSEDTSGIIIVDSIRKLVPEGLLKRIFAEVKDHANKPKGIDGMGGRGAQIKAAMNAQWMDELVPLLEETGTAFVCLTRETDDPDASTQDKMAGRDFKVGGGKALYYDGSMVLRVERASFVADSGDDEGKNKTMFGERHLVTIRKSKVAGREEFTTRAYFHTSNGNLIPPGFDRARDVVTLAEQFEIVEKRGAWFSYGDQRLGQGINGVVKNLTENEALLDEIEQAVRDSFKKHEPMEVNEETGEVA